MRKLLLPEWYLPNGTKSASEGVLENASSSCTRWSIGCGGLVVAFVAFEFVIACAHPPYDSPLERWGSAIADLFIMLGIVGEVLLGMWDDHIQTELRQRSNDKLGAAETAAANANERAANLEREAAEARARVAEIERLTAWRQVTRDQHAKIIPMLRILAPKIDLLVEYERGDMEAFAYSREIVTVFQEAGVKRVRQLPNSMSGTVWGVGLAVAPDMDGKSIADAFNNSLVPVTLFAKDLSVHLGRDTPSPNVYIFVAPKPPPV